MRRFLFLRFLVFISLFILPACTKTDKKSNSNTIPIIHHAHLVDGWYPQNITALNRDLDKYFDLARRDFPIVVDSNSVRALIVPHAGWYYSGLCAACAYQTLLSNGVKNSKFERVILLAPSHGAFVNGVALPDYNFYHTQLGRIEVDSDAVKILKKSQLFLTIKEAHEHEHAIEIQLPFLQRVLSNFRIVPLIVGGLTDDNLALVVKQLQKIINDKTLIIVSSDFIHHGDIYEYNPFKCHILKQIRYVDSYAIQIISTYSVPGFDEFLRQTGATICGFNPIRILIGLIHLQTFGSICPRLTCYYTSAQLAQSRKGDYINISKLFKDVEDKSVDGSVSYASIIFTTQRFTDLKDEDQLSGYDKKALLKFVRDKIENEFKSGSEKVPDYILYPIVTPVLQRPCGTFVTLNAKDGDLRGCIGKIVSDLPLYQIVGEMGIEAAFHDTRFKPVERDELDSLRLSISILTRPKKVTSYKDIQIGRDGIVLKKIGVDGQLITSAVFLPQVPSNFGWNLQMTLENLSQKAGLGKDGWKDNCEFEVFQSFEIKEH